MSWTSIKFDWNQARSFLVTAEEGSFSAAARALGLTQPTLSRQVATLEESLGVTLFERSGKALFLTQSGQEMLESARSMGEAAGVFSLCATGQSQSVTGKVTITASDILCTYVMPHLLTKLRAQAPGIKIEIVASNEIRDLVRREADIAIRHVQPQQPSLIAKRLRDGSAYLYGHRDYLTQIGFSGSAEDLRHATFIGIDHSSSTPALYERMGIPVNAENLSLHSNSGVVAWELVRNGHGLAVMAEGAALGAEGVVRVFPDKEPIVFENWLVSHRELRTNRCIRTVFDYLATSA